MKRYVICRGKDRYSENFFLCKGNLWMMGYSHFGDSKYSTAFYRRKGMAERRLAKLQKYGREKDAYVKELD